MSIQVLNPRVWNAISYAGNDTCCFHVSYIRLGVVTQLFDTFTTRWLDILNQSEIRKQKTEVVSSVCPHSSLLDSATKDAMSMRKLTLH
jgi:hypothetical protein